MERFRYHRLAGDSVKPKFAVRGIGGSKEKMFRTTALFGALLLALIALAPAVQVHAATQTININKTATFDNVTVTITGTINVDTTAKTVSGTLTVTAVNDTSGNTIFQRTFTFSFILAASGTASFMLVIPAVNTVLTASCMVAQSTTSSCIVSKSPDVNHDGQVNILDLAALASGYGSSNTSLDLDGDGIVSITDIAIAASDFNAPILF